MVGPCGLSGADFCALDVAGSTARAHKLIARKRISFSVEGKQKNFFEEDAPTRHRVSRRCEAESGNKRARTYTASSADNYATDSTRNANRPLVATVPLPFDSTLKSRPTLLTSISPEPSF